LPLIFNNSEDYESIDKGDILDVETTNLKSGEKVKIINKTKQLTFYLNTPLFQEDLDAIKEGGFVNILKAKNK